MDCFKQLIRDIPDFPKPGIVFRDITPLLRDGRAFAQTIDQFAERYARKPIDAVVAIESRGLVLGAALALRLKAGLVLVRKRGKLPHKTHQEPCELEYGSEVLEIHQDALQPHERVLIVDDVLATGGTMRAAIRLVGRLRAKVIETAFLIELTPLKGRKKLTPHSVFSLVKY